MDILSSVKAEIEAIEKEGLKSSNLNNLEKFSTIYKNLSTWKSEEKEETAEETIKTYSNNTYDRNMNELYDAYVSRRTLYQSDETTEHKENMIDSLSRLLVEISDLTTLIWNNATFTEERDLISNMLDVIDRH